MSSRRAKGRVSHADRYRIVASQAELYWRAFERMLELRRLRTSLGIYMTGPRAGAAIAMAGGK